MPARTLRSYGWRLVMMAAAALSAVQVAVAEDLPGFQTNESYVNDVLSDARLPLDSPRAMFAAVFATLRDQVKVFPTENYYYFSFFQRGVRYGGNIRLAAGDRDEGKLHFAYFEEFAEWHLPPPITHVVLGATDGVTVERVAKLTYRVTFRGKSVVFALNDLSGVHPPTMAPQEKFIGPVFDESAVRFFLLFDEARRKFRFVLDETVPASDQLTPLSRSDRILIGKRTGFAYYRDHRIDRKILIGVVETNVAANNYLDGPFDQLPDNFIDGEVLRDSIIAAEPSLAGKIDRYGTYLDGSLRYLIAPYLFYRRPLDLLGVHRCATSHVRRVDYYDCFAGSPSTPRARRSDQRPVEMQVPTQVGPTDLRIHHPRPFALIAILRLTQ